MRQSVVRFTLIAAALSVPLAMIAAVPPDKIAATGGDITIQPLNHATLQITYANHVILVDPVAQATYTGLAAPDIILITDIHGDHLDAATIAKVRKASTKIIAPAAAAPNGPTPTGG